jgi:uncharacterized iron-regulated membrane protein
MAVRKNGPISAARTCLFWTHLALGVVAGVAIFTMSVTGALLALQPQILEWVERDQRRVVEAEGARLDAAALIHAALRGQRWPESVTLMLFADPTQTATVSLGRDAIRYVDPYAGVLIGEGAKRTRRVFQWLTEFHRWFAAPLEWRSSARGVTGWSTLAFVALVLSGFLLWIPRNRGRSALVRSVTPGWAATPKARHFNWHTVVGFWSAPILLVLAISGVVLAFPWANRLLFVAAGTPLPASAARNEPRGAAPAGATDRADEPAVQDHQHLNEAWRAAEQRLPTWSTIALRIQGRTDGPLSFTITDAAHWNRFARSQLTISGKTGEVTRWEPYTEISRGQRWRGWARFAHTGELGGLTGQLLAGLASAGAALLVWTGISLAFRRAARSRFAVAQPGSVTTPALGSVTGARATLTQTEQRS